MTFDQSLIGSEDQEGRMFVCLYVQMYQEYPTFTAMKCNLCDFVKQGIMILVYLFITCYCILTHYCILFKFISIRMNICLSVVCKHR